MVEVSVGNKTLSDFVLRNEIGKGKFGKIFLAEDARSKDNLYAMKVIEDDGHNIKVEKNQIATLEFLQFHNLKANFIIKLHHHFQEENNLYMAFEFLAEGDLAQLLRRIKKFEESTAKFYAIQAILGVEYLHSANIVHRDIKPENMLLTSTGYLKLADFGFAKVIAGKRAYTFCGTTEYMAPEIIKRKGYDKAVDWWAIGVFIYEMLCGRPPFKEENKSKTFKKIKLCLYKFTGDFSDKSRAVVKKFLKKNPLQRLGNMPNKYQGVRDMEWLLDNTECSWNKICSQEQELPQEIQSQIAQTDLK